jgi:hypothetical protein
MDPAGTESGQSDVEESRGQKAGMHWVDNTPPEPRAESSQNATEPRRSTIES